MEKPVYPENPEMFIRSVKRMKKEIIKGHSAKVVAMEAMQILRTYFGPAWIVEMQKIEDATQAEFEAAQKALNEQAEEDNGPQGA